MSQSGRISCICLLTIALLLASRRIHAASSVFEWKENFFAGWRYSSLAALLHESGYKSFDQNSLKLLHSDQIVEILFTLDGSVPLNLPDRYLCLQRIAFASYEEMDKLWKVRNAEKSIISLTNEKQSLANMKRNFALFVADGGHRDDLNDAMIAISNAASAIGDIIDRILSETCKVVAGDFFIQYSRIVEKVILKTGFASRMMIETYSSQYLWPFLTSRINELVFEDGCICVSSTSFKRTCGDNQYHHQMKNLTNLLDGRQNSKLFFILNRNTTAVFSIENKSDIVTVRVIESQDLMRGGTEGAAGAAEAEAEAEATRGESHAGSSKGIQILYVIPEGHKVTAAWLKRQGTGGSYTASRISCSSGNAKDPYSYPRTVAADQSDSIGTGDDDSDETKEEEVPLWLGEGGGSGLGGHSAGADADADADENGKLGPLGTTVTCSIDHSWVEDYIAMLAASMAFSETSTGLPVSGLPTRPHSAGESQVDQSRQAEKINPSYGEADLASLAYCAGVQEGQEAPRMLLLGLGGGQLQSYLLRRHSCLRMHTVEISPEVLHAAQSWFELDVCHIDSVADYTTTAADTTDAVNRAASSSCRSVVTLGDGWDLVDALASQNQINDGQQPQHHYDFALMDAFESDPLGWGGNPGVGVSNPQVARVRSSLGGLRSLLGPSGLLLFHVHRDSQAEEYLAAIREAFPYTLIVAVAQNDDIIVGSSSPITGISRWGVSWAKAWGVSLIKAAVAATAAAPVVRADEAGDSDAASVTSSAAATLTASGEVLLNERAGTRLATQQQAHIPPSSQSLVIEQADLCTDPELVRAGMLHYGALHDYSPQVAKSMALAIRSCE